MNALSPAIKAERIESLEILIARSALIDSMPTWRLTITTYRDELRQLRAGQ
jgi:hypothetical protein